MLIDFALIDWAADGTNKRRTAGGLAQHTEEIIDPGREIIDPHHHMWRTSGSLSTFWKIFGKTLSLVTES